MRPERETHLIEATARKAAFIAETAAELGLHVHVHAERSEELGRGELRDACACVVARALAPPPVAVELCLPLVPARRAARAVVARAGRRRARRRGRGARAARCSPPECPGVLVIGKLEATPERFPRRPGMAAKRPLSAPRSDRPRR